LDVKFRKFSLVWLKSWIIWHSSGLNVGLRRTKFFKKKLCDSTRSATQAATRAAESAMAGIRHDLDNERAKLSQAAGEARRAAWRRFGGFWVWLASMLATGAVLGALAMAWIAGRGDAREFGQFPSIYCGTAGGQVVEQDNGSSYCAIWINRPDQ
jgi:hypothetical protein